MMKMVYVVRTERHPIELGPQLIGFVQPLLDIWHKGILLLFHAQSSDGISQKTPNVTKYYMAIVRSQGTRKMKIAM